MGASLMQRTNKLKGIVEGMTGVLKTTYPAPLFPGTRHARETRTRLHHAYTNHPPGTHNRFACIPYLSSPPRTSTHPHRRDRRLASAPGDDLPAPDHQDAHGVGREEAQRAPARAAGTVGLFGWCPVVAR